VKSRELQLGFGEAVRAARAKATMSQAQFAARSGIAQQDISKIERGEINLTIRTMSRLADVLDNDVAAMLAMMRQSSKPK
jgi:transcriptional regulator with XRE-family HTH domain